MNSFLLGAFIFIAIFVLQIKNPDVDIDHYLHGSNPIFRKFIDDGLAELERAAAENNQSDNKVLSENRFGVAKTIGKDPDYWMERLNALKVTFEWKLLSNETHC